MFRADGYKNVGEFLDTVDRRIERIESTVTSISPEVILAAVERAAVESDVVITNEALEIFATQEFAEAINDGLTEANSFININTLALDDHINDPTDAHDGSAISNIPAGSITSTDVQGAINELDASSIPLAGSIDYFGHTEPSARWKFPNGQQLLISAHLNVYNILTINGTVFPFGNNTDGLGNPGITHFRLPDMRGRTAFMRDLAAGVLTGTDTLGTTGGTQTHDLTPAQTPLRSHTHSGTTATDSVTHTHSGTTGNDNIDHTHSGTTGDINQNHTHTINGFIQSVGTILATTNTGPASRFSNNTLSGTTGTVSGGHTHNFSTGGRSAFHQHAITTGNNSVSHTHTVTTGTPSVAEANGTAHENMPPHMRVNKLIRVL